MDQGLIERPEVQMEVMTQQSIYTSAGTFEQLNLAPNLLTGVEVVRDWCLTHCRIQEVERLQHTF